MKEPVASHYPGQRLRDQKGREYRYKGQLGSNTILVTDRTGRTVKKRLDRYDDRLEPRR